MAGEPSTDQLRTALVVLAVNPPSGAGGFTVAGGAPAKPEGAEAVRKWFLDRGFDVDPVVGIAFSISGPGSLFSHTFGDAHGGALQQGTPLELDQAALAGRLRDDLLRYVAAVVVGPAPDFGPGNP